MIGLLATEVRRLLARRLLRYLLLAFLLGLLLIAVITAVRSNRDFAAAHRKALAQAQLEEENVRQAIAQCPTSQPAGGCEFLKLGPQPPTVDELAAEIYQDPRFPFATTAAGIAIGVVAAISVLGFVVGAAFVGAEWAAGTMASLLTWEPRRLRVLAAKLVAVVVVLAVAGALAVALTLATFWVIAATRGTTAHTTSHVMSVVLSRSLRGLLLIALLTGAGAAIAGFSRHTPAALVAMVVYLIAFETVLRHFRPGWVRWFLTENAGAVLTGRVRIFLPPPPGGFNQFTTQRGYVLHGGRATLYLVALLIVLVAAWAVTFVRRDIDEGSGR